jgi:hypothetical protein
MSDSDSDDDEIACGPLNEEQFHEEAKAAKGDIDVLGGLIDTLDASDQMKASAKAKISSISSAAARSDAVSLLFSKDIAAIATMSLRGLHLLAYLRGGMVRNYPKNGSTDDHDRFRVVYAKYIVDELETGLHVRTKKRDGTVIIKPDIHDYVRLMVCLASLPEEYQKKYHANSDATIRRGSAYSAADLPLRINDHIMKPVGDVFWSTHELDAHDIASFIPRDELINPAAPKPPSARVLAEPFKPEVLRFGTPKQYQK